MMINSTALKNQLNQRQSFVGAMLAAMLLLTGCGGESEVSTPVTGSGVASGSGASDAGSGSFTASTFTSEFRNAAGSMGAIETRTVSRSSGAGSSVHVSKAVRLSNAAGATRTHDFDRYSQDLAGKKMAETANLGGAGYASAALTSLLQAVDGKSLVDHLEVFWQQSSDAAQTLAAEDFIHLVLGAHAGTGAVTNELEAFLQSLQKMPAFHAMGQEERYAQSMDGQNAAHAFLLQLSDTFGLAALPGALAQAGEVAAAAD